MKITLLKSLLTAVLAIGLTACGGAESGGESTATGGETATTGDAAASTEVVIQPVGNEMKYDKTSFSVEAGQEVTIVFENVADSPAMQHNVVVLNSDDDADVNRVGQAGIAAGEANDYIPEDEAILAHTPLAQPGETVEVTFTAPTEPGTYRYICTFPGHYMVMQGTMTVT